MQVKQISSDFHNFVTFSSLLDEKMLFLVCTNRTIPSLFTMKHFTEMVLVVYMATGVILPLISNACAKK